MKMAILREDTRFEASFLITLCLSLFRISSAQQGLAFPFYTDSLDAVKYLSESECIDECISYSECKSLTIKEGDICILYPFVASWRNQLVESPNFRYMERQEAAYHHDGACSYLVCGKGHKCSQESCCGCARCVEDVVREERKFSDCLSYAGAGYTLSGLYRIQLLSQSIIAVCDFDAGGVVWTQIQRRINGDVDFNRTWAEYERGFGSIEGEFWLGNKHIQEITSIQHRKLSVEFETCHGNYVYQKYDNFSLDVASEGYGLTSVPEFTFTSGNLFIIDGFLHQMKPFTTADRTGDSNCGKDFASGWWFNGCHFGNFNGLYCSTPNSNCGSGYMSWTLYNYMEIRYVSLRSSIMGVM